MYGYEYEQQKSKSTVSPTKRFGPVLKLQLTIEMIKQCIAQNQRIIDDIQFGQAIIVAKVVHIDSKPHKAVFTLTDHTGSVRVAKIIEKQGDNLQELEGKYTKMFVSVNYSGKEIILYCQSYKVVEDFNMISDHIGQVIVGHLRRKNGPKKTN